MDNPKMRVGIRGMGSLGERLYYALPKQQDMEVAVAIVLNAEEKNTLIRGWKADYAPPHIFIKEPDRSLEELIDVLVDTKTPGEAKKWDDKHRIAPYPVIVQSGEFPYGRLISLPLLEGGEHNPPHVFRQGDCIITTLTNVLTHLNGAIRRLDLDVMMQYSKPLHIKPRAKEIHATYLGREQYPDYLISEMRKALPEKGFSVGAVYEMPGLVYYALTLRLDAEPALTQERVLEILQATPRTLIAPASWKSTADIETERNAALQMGRDIAPIVVFPYTARQTEGGPYILSLFVDSRRITSLSLIDSIRMLARNMPPLDAMRATDAHAGFVWDYKK
ncbi:hypothetical protein HZB01_03885 [Candidatus Woesearchaeota archaeon]|nr:hypothetical protein [Candidatus Woesearchaeota archaeon]